MSITFGVHSHTMRTTLTRQSYVMTCSDNVDTFLGSVVLVNEEMPSQCPINIFSIKNKFSIASVSCCTVSIVNEYIRGVFDYCTNGDCELLKF